MTFQIYKNRLSRDEQELLLTDVRSIIAAAPLFKPVTSYGNPFRVEITNAGLYGWISDEKGYRYVETRPGTTESWPPIPSRVAEVANDLASVAGYPNCAFQSCLVNYYAEGGRLGAHQDKDEQDFSKPIVSISLGDSCVFSFGGLKRSDEMKDYNLNSGDCVVFGGEHRLCYHAVKKVLPRTSNLLPNGGRYNLTIRQVKP